MAAVAGASLGILGWIHPEARAAAKLFRDAVEREEASVDYARQVLRFLFRSRHDQGLRFGS